MINGGDKQSFLDYDDIQERYVLFRQKSRALNSKLTRLLGKKAILAGARTLGLLGRKNTLVLNNDQEYPLLMDYCIHSVLEQGSNLVDRLAANPPDEFSREETDLLCRLAQSFYTLFGIEDVVPDVGVWVIDMFHRGERIFIADQAFGQTAKTKTVMAGRLIPLGDFFATSGAALPVRLDLLRPIKRIVDKVIPPHEAAKISKVTRTQEALFSAGIIRLLLDHGASSEITYEPVEQEDHDFPAEDSGHEAGIEDAPQEALESSRQKVGRNDPCPCGSGLKYKKCCARK